MSSDNPCKNVTDPQPVPRTTIFGRLPLLCAAGLSLLKVLIPAATEAAAPPAAASLPAAATLAAAAAAATAGPMTWRGTLEAQAPADRWSFRPSRSAAGTADTKAWLGGAAGLAGLAGLALGGWRTAATGLEIPALRGATKHGDAMGPNGQGAQLNVRVAILIPRVETSAGCMSQT